MMLRRCGTCARYLPLGAFAWRRIERNQRDNLCWTCRAAYKRRHDEANRQRYIDAAATRRGREVERRTALLLTYLAEHPCVDCDEADPLVLEFDHVGEKRFDIAKGLRDRPWRDVIEEIGRCVVVCANCHRRRTARRGSFARHVQLVGPDVGDSAHR